jgi:Ca2+-binding RTX toxin-like protein
VLGDATLVGGALTWDGVDERAGGGIDTVHASAHVGRYTYQLGANVENLVATGFNVFRLWGNELDNRLTGNIGANVMAGFGGNDRLDGLLGLDDLAGGLGNDVYVLGDATLVGASLTWDTVTEDADAGIDTVRASADAGRYTCQLGTNVENLVATGVNVFRLWGNGLDNRLTGNANNNVIAGFGGDDWLVGGIRQDDLTGGSGADRFDFNLVADSGLGATRDRILDFTHLVDDIDLSTIDAVAATATNDSFVFIGTAGFSAEGQIRAVQSGADTIVAMNTAGATGGEMQLLLSNFTAATLTAADFVL